MLTLSQRLLSLTIMLSVFQVNYSAAIEISSYARVSRNGDSINIQSDKGNKSIDQTTTKVSDIDSTLIDKHNDATTIPPAKAREAKQMNDNSSGEKSTGRAVQSNYYFPLTQLLQKPVQSNSYNYAKSGRRIVYPSYSAIRPNGIDQTRMRYNMMRPTGQQKQAQRRFQYTPDSLYKFKGVESSKGYQYAKPPTDKAPPPSKFAAPIVVPDSQPPQSSYLPPNPAYLPPNMMPPPPGRHFLPTILPDSTPPNPVIDLLAYPSHVNSSYLPPELHAIRDSIENNHQSADETTNTPVKYIYSVPSSSGDNLGGSDESTDEPESYTPATNLYDFPPNIGAAYLPPGMTMKNKSPTNSYLPPPSGDGDNADDSDDTNGGSEAYMPPKDLYAFPPNIHAGYLPPSAKKNKAIANSYLPPPFGDNSGEAVENSLPEPEKPASFTPPEDLHSFPPNVGSVYLPPNMMMQGKVPVSSYLPPPSGDDMEDSEDGNGGQMMPYVPPQDLHNFPPNIGSSYLPPSMTKGKSLASSYLPPPSGHEPDNPGDSNGDSEMSYMPPKDLHNFPPNIDSSYLPPEMKVPDIPNNSYLPPASGSETDVPSPPYMYNVPQPYVYNPPQKPYNYNPPSKPFNFPPNIQSSYLPPGMKQAMAPVNSYLPPPSGSVSGFYEGSKPNFPGPMAPPQMDQMQMAPPQMDQMQMAPPQMDQMPTGPMDMGMAAPQMDQMPTGPMGMGMSAPPDDHSHHHSHHHDYSDLIYDDPHHHHHHHVEETTTTTEAPEPEEPRVKKYSYYYLGRKLWYVPLYFTLWFCLYVAALIIRSIGRHKVDLPNHYVSRSLHDMSHQETVEKINRMTEFAMQQIEDFKEKYL